ncbi:hypothetical protein [Azomonas macrocytogenes]|uniref:Uncharacterized protein n=1 Tax=Azomonas macrocytogenes TaxID=69962 RepID=A0A839T0U0_AZOMA|nr:hypothetical protein [Azomonas macrocytogenes]MBB3103161.1 hypothetical protein [Azomonas macrocytogenes]
MYPIVVTRPTGVAQIINPDGSFTRGFVATACLSACQDNGLAQSPEQIKRILKHALQGGTALAAGSHAAVAVQRKDYLGALLATTAGAAGVLLVERLLREHAQTAQEVTDGQEA